VGKSRNKGPKDIVEPELRESALKEDQQAQRKETKPTRGVGPNINKRVPRKRLRNMYLRSDGKKSFKEYVQWLAAGGDSDAQQWLINKGLKAA
jgi:hypothetical protein